MSRYLDIARRGSHERTKHELHETVATTLHVPAPPQPEAATNSSNSYFVRSSKLHYQDVLAVLESRCPDYVDADRWHRAIADGKRFLSAWGEQALGLGWSNRDLFGLAK